MSGTITLCNVKFVIYGPKTGAAFIPAKELFRATTEDRPITDETLSTLVKVAEALGGVTILADFFAPSEGDEFRGVPRYNVSVTWKQGEGWSKTPEAIAEKIGE